MVIRVSDRPPGGIEKLTLLRSPERSPVRAHFITSSEQRHLGPFDIAVREPEDQRGNDRSSLEVLACHRPIVLSAYDMW